jgi:cystathionine gamma-lyase
MNEGINKLAFATRAIHAGCEPDQLHGGVNPSLELSSTYAQPTPGQPSSCFDYSRCGNPTILALQRNLASMELANFAFALNSGMSATVSVLSLLKHGDHFLCIDDVYGGTQRYIRKVYTP